MKEIYDLVTLMGDMREKYRFSEVPAIKHDNVGTHTFRLILLVQSCERLVEGIDVQKATKIALYHDFGEVITGDIDAHLLHTGAVKKEDKAADEAQAIKEITKYLPDDMRDEIIEYWNDYENSISLEARYVKALDKLEGMMTVTEHGSEAIDIPDLLGNYGNKGGCRIG